MHFLFSKYDLTSSLFVSNEKTCLKACKFELKVLDDV